MNTAAAPVASTTIDLQCVAKEKALPAGVNAQLWVATTLEHAGAQGPGLVTIRIVDSDESQALNESFRGGNGATNVLSFPAGENHLPPQSNSGELPELGDLVICLPLVYSEAEQQQILPLAHLSHLVVHGTLHLVSYTHDGVADAEKMESLESEIMGKLGFSDPYTTDNGND